MPYDILPFIIIIISFVFIIIIIGKKIPTLKVLDVNTLVEEKEQRVKKTLLEMRLKRNCRALCKIIVSIIKPVLEIVLNFIRKAYHRILAMEEEYKNKNIKEKEMALQPQERLEKYLHEAIKALEGDMPSSYALAEENFIKVIEIDNKNIEAYEGLKSLYLKTKDYKKAQEIARYILKMHIDLYKKDQDSEKKHILASDFMTSGAIERCLNNISSALKNYKEAIQLEPNNPKFLDELLNFSIMIKDKKLALDTLQKLKIADPDNQKLSDLDKQVSGL